jgi:hypothetical protein
MRRRTYDILTNVQIFLTGEAAAAVEGYVEVSFDRGMSFQPLTRTPLILPGQAVGPDAPDGTLGPFDTARLALRVRIPEACTDYRVLRFALGVDCDVI